MDIDKAGRDQLAPGIQGLVHTAFKAWADIQNAVIFQNHDPIPQDGMVAILETNDPTALDQCTHGLLL